MSSFKTVAKVSASDLSSELRRRLGLRGEETVNLTVEPIPERDDPWPAIKGTLSAHEGEELRQLVASSRCSRKAPPQVN